MAKRMSGMDLVAAILVIIGGLNLGVVGLFGINLVEALFSWAPMLMKLIYVLVGVAAVYQIYYLAK